MPGEFDLLGRCEFTLWTRCQLGRKGTAGVSFQAPQAPSSMKMALNKCWLNTRLEEDGSGAAVEQVEFELGHARSSGWCCLV